MDCRFLGESLKSATDAGFHTTGECSTALRGVCVETTSLEGMLAERASQWRSCRDVSYTRREDLPSELSSAMRAPESISTVSAPADLVQRVRNGDPQAETLLVKTYQRPVIEMLRNRSGDPDLAQDLLQETFIVVLRRLRTEGIEQPHKLAAYIHRVAHNLVIGHFRKETRRNTRLDSEAVELQPDSGAVQLETVLRDEMQHLVRKLLGQLSAPRDREILQRFYVWGQEKRLVCNELALDPDQFDKVISRARQRFRKLVERELDR